MWGNNRWGTLLWSKGSQSVSLSTCVGEVFSIVANVPTFRITGTIQRIGLVTNIQSYR